MYPAERLSTEQAFLEEARIAEEEALQVQKTEKDGLEETTLIKAEEDQLVLVAAVAKTAENKAVAQAAIIVEQNRQQALIKVAQEKAIAEAQIAAKKVAALKAAQTAEAQAVQKLAAEKAAAKAATRKSRAS
jgi:maltodextrin utilization protein YvdJ